MLDNDKHVSIEPVDAPHHLEKIRELQHAVSVARAVQSDCRDAYVGARAIRYRAERDLTDYLEGLETEMPLFDHAPASAKRPGDCPNFAESSERNGTVPLPGPRAPTAAPARKRARSRGPLPGEDMT